MNNKRTKNSVHGINLLTKAKTHKRNKTLTGKQAESLPKLQHMKSELPSHIPDSTVFSKTSYFRLSNSRNNTDRDYLESVDVEEALKCSSIRTSNSTAFIKKIRLESKTVRSAGSTDASVNKKSLKTNCHSENRPTDSDKKSTLTRFKRRKFGILHQLPTQR